VTEKEILENHDRLATRTAVFRQFGYDPDTANAFILSQTPDCSSPAMLEIGSGKGRFLVALLKRHAVTSVDIDCVEQRYARLNVAYEGLSDRVRFVQADGLRLPFRDACFSAVFSVNALHHFPSWKPLLAEVLRVVEPLGAVVLADFSEDGFAVLDAVHSSEGRVHPRVRYRVEDIAEYLKTEGWGPHMAEAERQWVLTARRSQPTASVE
jgi:ubiquinone/menaquinone biosynthesis C-methylase UbiE